ncbi:hypothetical protein ACJX0J_025438, partial [Zea mays]
FSFVTSFVIIWTNGYEHHLECMLFLSYTFVGDSWAMSKTAFSVLARNMLCYSVSINSLFIWYKVPQIGDNAKLCMYIIKYHGLPYQLSVFPNNYYQHEAQLYA